MDVSLEMKRIEKMRREVSCQCFFAFKLMLVIQIHILVHDILNAFNAFSLKLHQ